MKSVENGLDEIEKPKQEFSLAMSNMREIEKKLDILEEHSQIETIEIDIEDIRNVLNQIRSYFGSLSKEFDEVKNSVHRLFAELNSKKGYTLKSRNFFIFMLEEAKLDENKNIVFPLPSEWQGRLAINFHAETFRIVEEGRIKDTETIKSSVETHMDKALFEQQEQQEAKKNEQRNKLHFWIDTLKEDLQKHNMLLLSSYFHLILEQDNFEVFVEILNFLLNHKEMLKYDIKTIPTPIYYKDNYMTWEMKITKNT